MDWDAVKFEKAIVGLLRDGLIQKPSFAVKERPSDVGMYRPDLVIRTDIAKDYVVECKYYGNPKEDLHFGTIAQTAATADALRERVGKDVDGVIFTNGSVPSTLSRLAEGMHIRIVSISQPDLDHLPAIKDRIVREITRGSQGWG